MHSETEIWSWNLLLPFAVRRFHGIDLTEMNDIQFIRHICTHTSEGVSDFYHSLPVIICVLYLGIVVDHCPEDPVAVLVLVGTVGAHQGDPARQEYDREKIHRCSLVLSSEIHGTIFVTDLQRDAESF